MEIAYSILEDKKELILEKRIVGKAHNLRVMVIADRNINTKEIYQIEFKPKDLNHGIFCVVLFEETDNSLYLCETYVSKTTYADALKRLEKIHKQQGFIVKMIPLTFSVYGILPDSSKEFIEVGLTRTQAKEKTTVLTSKLNSKYTEIDFDIDDGDIL